MAFTGSTIPRGDAFRIIINLIQCAAFPRKFSCRVFIQISIYILLMFISRENKLVCVQRASKKITRFVPLRVHLLAIRRLGNWNTLPRRRSGCFSSSLVFLHDICLYLQLELTDALPLLYLMSCDDSSLFRWVSRIQAIVSFTKLSIIQLYALLLGLFRLRCQQLDDNVCVI